MRKLFSIFVLSICIFLVNITYAQDRIKKIETQLKSMVVEMPGLEEKVEMSVSGVSIQEFMRGIADAHKLNISVDPSIQQAIVNNFANATVNDVILFVCREYNLNINFIGSILSIVKYVPVAEKKLPPAVRQPTVIFNAAKNELTLDLQNDSLAKVTKLITQKSKKNIVLSPGIAAQPVSVYIENMPFANALEKLGFANKLSVTKTDDNFFLIEKQTAADPETVQQMSRGKSGLRGKGRKKTNNAEASADFEVEATDASNISVYGVDVSIDELVKTVSKKIGINYYLISELKGNTTVNVEQTSYEDLLQQVFQGTDFTYELTNGIYIIGERKTEGLRTTKVFQLQHRTVEKVVEYIPSDLKKDITINEFVDLNSLILSGSEPQIAEIEKLLQQIDKVVPVIMIEVMIVDYSNTRSNSTGIEVGLGENPATTAGIVYPETNVSLSSTSINELIESFNGYGVLNLGKVTPNFYVNINALESQGILRVKSTPKLATLNGHEATMSIGNTEFYYEEQNNVISNVGTQNITTRTYKSVSADLSVTVKPFVSGDDQITLDVSVSQSDFTSKIEPGAPPGSVSRDFTSVIRVKNQEMILLGGLEEKSIRDSGSGVPFLSRIPIIKWFFSSRVREKGKNKLNIFIKPTVIY